MKVKTKWFISNNEVNINKNIVNILPYIKLWYSPYYFLETGVYTPAVGIAVSWLKFNYYFTIQKAY
jgi:hypothetical protein